MRKVYDAFARQGQGDGVESSEFSSDVLMEADQEKTERFLREKHPAFWEMPVKIVTGENGWGPPFVGGVKAEGVDTNFQVMLGSIAMYLDQNESLGRDTSGKGDAIAMQEPLVSPDPVIGKLLIGFPAKS